MAEPRWTVDEVNGWDQPTFVARLGFLFEDSPWVAATGWAARPFAGTATLHRALAAAVSDAGRDRQLALIRAHPDLVGRAAVTGRLTRASTGEQQAAGLDPGHLTAEEIAYFTELNESYRQRFSFPFVVCARENTKAAILAGFVTRLTNDEEAEIATALAEIAKIAWYRLADAVGGR